MINSGSISNSDYTGITTGGSSGKISNSCSIIAGGTRKHKALGLRDRNTVENSGCMSNTNSNSIFVDGTGIILKVVNGYIVGGIDMGSSGTIGVTTGASHSRLNAFEGS